MIGRAGVGVATSPLAAYAGSNWYPRASGDALSSPASLVATKTSPTHRILAAVGNSSFFFFFSSLARPSGSRFGVKTP